MSNNYLSESNDGGAKSEGLGLSFDSSLLQSVSGHVQLYICI